MRSSAFTAFQDNFKLKQGDYEFATDTLVNTPALDGFVMLADFEHVLVCGTVYALPRARASSRVRIIR